MVTSSILDGICSSGFSLSPSQYVFGRISYSLISFFFILNLLVGFAFLFLLFHLWCQHILFRMCWHCIISYVFVLRCLVSVSCVHAFVCLLIWSFFFFLPLLLATWSVDSSIFFFILSIMFRVKDQ